MRVVVKTQANLVDFLLEKLGSASKTRVRKLLKYGGVTVDGRPAASPQIELFPGQVVEIHHPRPKPELPFPILFEDEHLLVIDKPAGLLSVPSAKEKEKTAHTLAVLYTEALPNRPHAFVVHRLDAQTSGVLVFAKSDLAQQAIKRRWPDVEKHYTALVEGMPRDKTGVVETWLKENEQGKVHVCEQDGEAELAITQYRVLKTFARHSLLDVVIKTGRKNQIRVHMAWIGCPVVGDEKYGAETDPLNRLGLHAALLKITHPQTGERLTLESPLPREFKIFLAREPEAPGRPRSPRTLKPQYQDDDLPPYRPASRRYPERPRQDADRPNRPRRTFSDDEGAPRAPRPRRSGPETSPASRPTSRRYPERPRQDADRPNRPRRTFSDDEGAPRAPRPRRSGPETSPANRPTSRRYPERTRQDADRPNRPRRTFSDDEGAPRAPRPRRSGPEDKQPRRTPPRESSTPRSPKPRPENRGKQAPRTPRNPGKPAGFKKK